MCNLDVLGLTRRLHWQIKYLYEGFKEKLQNSEEGYYITHFPHYHLIRSWHWHDSEKNSRKLEKIEKLEQYNKLMQDQINNGILEKVYQQQTDDVVNFIPHQAVIWKDEELTKMKIVYDCTANQNTEGSSLSDSLETLPPLQPLIFDLQLRSRMNSYCILADIQKAFLQIKLDEKDKDAQRLAWYRNLEEIKIVELRFTRQIFGAGPRSYIFGWTLETHLDP